MLRGYPHSQLPALWTPRSWEPTCGSTQGSEVPPGEGFWAGAEEGQESNPGWRWVRAGAGREGRRSGSPTLSRGLSGPTPPSFWAAGGQARTGHRGSEAAPPRKSCPPRSPRPIPGGPQWQKCQCVSETREKRRDPAGLRVWEAGAEARIPGNHRREAGIPMQPDCRAGLWATGGPGARPTRPIRQGKTPGLGGLPFFLAPQPPPRPRLLLPLF